MSVRVLLADDHQMLREGVAEMLTQTGQYEVVGQAGDGREALRLIAELHPDVVITDLTMPEMNGLDLAGQIVQNYPHIKVIIISMHADPARVVHARMIPVQGYLLKSEAGDRLIEALRTVVAGGTFFSEQLPFIEGHNFNSLSPRERETLQLLAEGKSVKDIAAVMGISHKTAETHRAHVMAKLRLHSIADLTRYAVAHGLTKL